MFEKKLKIAYLLGSVNRGGTETLLLDCFLNTSLTDYEMICIHRKPGNLLTEITNSGIKVLKIKSSFDYDIRLLSRLRRILQDERVDIVHAQQPFDAFLAYISCLFTPIKIILTFHGYDKNTNWIDQWIIKYITLHIDMNIYVSKSQQEYYASKYLLKNSGRRKVVYNGISFKKLDIDKQNYLQLEFNIPQNALILGTVGNFTSGRDQMTICRFLSLLKFNLPDFRFIFAGARTANEPQLYDDCINYIISNNLGKNTIFAGIRKDIPSLLKQLDAFIYSSNHDTFGIAVIEAMATGTPVFVNDWEVMKEVTGNGQLVTIYKTKDEQDLLAKFLHFLEHRELYQQKAAEASVWVREHYSIQKHIRELSAIYSNLMIETTAG